MGDIEITNSIFQNFKHSTIFSSLDANSQILQPVLNLKFSHNQVKTSAGGFYFAGKYVNTTYRTLTCEIMNNTMTGYVSPLSSDKNVKAAILISEVYSVKIESNTITGVPENDASGNGHAIQAWSIRDWSI